MEYDIRSLLEEIDFTANELQDVGHNVLLTRHEIEVLDRYEIDYKKCLDLKAVIKEIEDVLEDADDTLEDLELVSEDIAERDYYFNTNK